MSPPPGVLSRPTKLERQRDRAPLGKLSKRLISDRARGRYKAACIWFFNMIAAFGWEVPNTRIEFDIQVCKIIDAAWEEGESRSLIGDLLSGLPMFVHFLRGQLPGAWRMFAAWGRLELPMRAWPLTREQVMAMCAVLYAWDLQDVALVVLLQFHALLRAGEGLSARSNQFTFSPDFLQGHMALPFTKGSARKGAVEGVSITCQALCQMLINHFAGLPAGTPLLQRTPAQYRIAFSGAVTELGLNGHFRPYSLRRGGATHHFLVGGQLDKTTDRGRWGNTRTARIYINTSLAQQ